MECDHAFRVIPAAAICGSPPSPCGSREFNHIAEDHPIARREWPEAFAENVDDPPQHGYSIRARSRGAATAAETAAAPVPDHKGARSGELMVLKEPQSLTSVASLTALLFNTCCCGPLPRCRVASGVGSCVPCRSVLPLVSSSKNRLKSPTRTDCSTFARRSAVI